MRYILVFFLLSIIILSVPSLAFAQPASNNYQLHDFGFGAGGNSASSSSYQMLGIAGEQSGNPETGNAYKGQPGLLYTHQANVPAAPTFTNPASTYNRLKLIINTSDNPSDSQFAVAITSDNWTTTNYIQNDFTINNSLGSEDWMTYSSWGGASGVFITNLASNTTYTVKVKARQGNFTETGWGPTATAVTSVPSLSFSVSGNSITFSELLGENSWTDSSKFTTLTTSTNAYHGYSVYAHATQPLTFLSNTIPHFVSPNSTPTVWSATGFGYTTSDASLTGGTADRFTNGGPKYAGFTESSPGDPVADHIGPIVETPITNEQFTVNYRVTASETTPAGDYTTTIVYVVVPVY